MNSKRFQFLLVCLLVCVGTTIVVVESQTCPRTKDYTISRNNQTLFRISVDGGIFLCNGTNLCDTLATLLNRTASTGNQPGSQTEPWLQEGTSVYREQAGSILALGPEGIDGPAFDGLNSTRAEGLGKKFLWYGKKAAIRAGEVTERSRSNDTNIGFASTAFGSDTLASGDYSTAFGQDSRATGFFSTAFGRGSTASETVSTAFGVATQAIAFVSTAFGRETTAFGDISTAFGQFTNASGTESTAFGRSTKAVGFVSTAFGQQSLASGSFSTATSFQTEATALAEVAIGLCNVAANPIPNPGQSNETDSVLSVGNGVEAGFAGCRSRSNVLTAFKNGDLYVNGNIYYNIGDTPYPLTTNNPGGSCVCLARDPTTCRAGCTAQSPAASTARREEGQQDLEGQVKVLQQREQELQREVEQLKAKMERLERILLKSN